MIKAEIRENEFCTWELVVGGNVIAESSHPSPLYNKAITDGYEVRWTGTVRKVNGL